jgi:hypothetical protein
MRRLIPSAAAISAAVLTLMLFASAVRSGASADRAGQAPAQAAASVEQARSGIDSRAGSGSFQSAPEFTRIVTITVGTTVPLGLSSRWQIDQLSQDIIPSGGIHLPPDASDISVTLVNGECSIDVVSKTIWITNSQGLYYEYRTDQHARRFGNQILISQTFIYNRPSHYVGTVIFTGPYEYVGYSGYAPAHINATRLDWDEFVESLVRFEAATWLVDPDPMLAKPDLEITDARVVDRRLNRIYVTATIHNYGPIAAGAPAFVNLYDRLAPSLRPAGPLDLAGGWCTLDPVTACGISTSSRLPPIPRFETVIYTAEYDLSPTHGSHDIYLFVDALGGSNGLNDESAEANNFTEKPIGSLTWYRSFIFLPLIRRE